LVSCDMGASNGKRNDEGMEERKQGQAADPRGEGGGTAAANKEGKRSKGKEEQQEEQQQQQQQQKQEAGENETTADSKNQDSTMESILHFWFGPAKERWDPCYSHRYELWFSRRFDEIIREKFGKVVIDAGEGKYKSWEESPLGCVALVVLLDQFQRNLNRGSAKMFMHDALCQELTRKVWEKKWHSKLAVPEQLMLLLVLSHSEHSSDHVLAKEWYEYISQNAPYEQQQYMLGHYRMEKVHFQEIKKFGRYPHRNALLGRESTTEELKWLSEVRKSHITT